MTLLHEKLEDAGVDTLGARLTAACIEAIRKSPESTVEAWRQVGYAFGHEFVRGLMKDMNPSAVSAPPPSWRETPAISARPLPVRQPPSPEAKARVASIVKAAVTHLRFGHLTSDGKDWADVGAHELDGMDRDGALARVLKSRIGVLSNSDRFKSLGELLTAKAFNEAKDALK